MRSLLIGFVGLLLAGCGGVGRGGSVDAATAAAVRARVESGDYTATFDVMTPVKGRSVTLTHDWFVRVGRGVVSSYLPYVGEAHAPVVVMGRQQGLDFETKYDGYSVKEGKRGSMVVNFWATTSEDSYSYTLTVYPNGRVYLVVSPDRKTSVSYDGKLIY